MQIKRETKVFVETTDGNPMVIGDRYVFAVDGKSYIGDYAGISKRGAIEFENVLQDCKFAVMPKSIDFCYKSNVIVGKVDK